MDVNFIFDLLKKTKEKLFNQQRLPKLNKAIDDRLKRKSWYLVKKVPDVIIFEGWCVGARAEKNITLKKSINSLERKEDKNLRWRKYGLKFNCVSLGKQKFLFFANLRFDCSIIFT